MNINGARILVTGGCGLIGSTIHMAALRITACTADPREAMEVMRDGSFNVVDAARRCAQRKGRQA